MDINSDTKRGVKRNGLFPILESKVFCGELDGIIRSVGFHINLQAFSLCVVGGFDLDGDKLTLTLNDKINFSSAGRLPIIGRISSAPKSFLAQSSPRSDT